MLTQGCCHFSGKPSTTCLSGSEVSLKKMCYEILPPLRSVRMTLPRKLNDLWVNCYIITKFVRSADVVCTARGAKRQCCQLLAPNAVHSCPVFGTFFKKYREKEFKKNKSERLKVEDCREI